MEKSLNKNEKTQNGEDKKPSSGLTKDLKNPISGQSMGISRTNSQAQSKKYSQPDASNAKKSRNNEVVSRISQGGATLDVLGGYLEHDF